MLTPSLDNRESITLSSIAPHLGQRIVEKAKPHSLYHKIWWCQRGNARAPLLLAFRGSNSNTIFPSSSLRYAENGRPFFEMKPASKSVFPLFTNFSACSLGICFCKITLFNRRVQVLAATVAFSHAYAFGSS